MKNRLKVLRAEQGWTQQDLGDRLGVSRQAVNALLDRSGSTAQRCTVTPLYRAPELEPFRRHDRTRYLLGLPNAFDIG